MYYLRFMPVVRCKWINQLIQYHWPWGSWCWPAWAAGSRACWASVAAFCRSRDASPGPGSCAGAGAGAGGGGEWHQVGIRRRWLDSDFWSAAPGSSSRTARVASCAPDSASAQGSSMRSTNLHKRRVSLCLERALQPANIFSFLSSLFGSNVDRFQGLGKVIESKVGPCQAHRHRRRHVCVWCN